MGRRPIAPPLPLLRCLELLLLGDVLVGGADDLAGGHVLLHAVGTPAGDTGNGKEGGIHFGGNVQHAVDKTGVHIHIGAHLLRASLEVAEEIRRQTLDGFEQVEVIAVALLVGLLAGEFLEQHGAGIGLGVDRVAHTVDESATVAGLLVEDLQEVGRKLVVVAVIFDIGLNLVEHLLHLEVGTAVAGALEGADAAGDGGVGVRSRGGQHARGEGRAVTAAVLGVNDQAEVQEMRLGLGVLLVGTEHAQEVLGGGQVVVRIVQVEGLVEEGVAVDRIGLRSNDRQAGDDLDGLAEHVVQRHIIGVVVVGVQRDDRRLELVHDGARGRLHDDVLGKAGRQRTQGGQQVVEFGQLVGRGQMTEEEQKAGLLKAEAVLGGEVFDQVTQVVAAVLQHTLDGVFFALVQDVAVSRAHAGDTRHNAASVGLAQTSLDAVAVEGRARQGIGFARGLQQGLKLPLDALVDLNIIIRYGLTMESHGITSVGNDVGHPAVGLSAARDAIFYSIAHFGPFCKSYREKFQKYFSFGDFHASKCCFLHICR